MTLILRYTALGIGLLILFILGTNLTFYLGTKDYIYTDATIAPHAEVALVLGASLAQDGKPAPIFTDRMDSAVALYKAGKVPKILVSGDNSTVAHNEVNPARLYLISNGIPDEDIFLDHAGFDTYSSLYRARAIFGVSSVLITTQSFHLSRALFIARGLGMTAYGVDTDVGYILPRNYVREVFAREKALIDLVIGRKPKYLGDAIPIHGDGRLYP